MTCRHPKIQRFKLSRKIFIFFSMVPFSIQELCLIDWTFGYIIYSIQDSGGLIIYLSPNLLHLRINTWNLHIPQHHSFGDKQKCPSLRGHPFLLLFLLLFLVMCCLHSVIVSRLIQLYMFGCTLQKFLSFPCDLDGKSLDTFFTRTFGHDMSSGPQLLHGPSTGKTPLVSCKILICRLC